MVAEANPRGEQNDGEAALKFIKAPERGIYAASTWTMPSCSRAVARSHGEAA